MPDSFAPFSAEELLAMAQNDLRHSGRMRCTAEQQAASLHALGAVLAPALRQTRTMFPDIPLEPVEVTDLAHKIHYRQESGAWNGKLPLWSPDHTHSFNRQGTVQEYVDLLAYGAVLHDRYRQMQQWLPLAAALEDYSFASDMAALHHHTIEKMPQITERMQATQRLTRGLQEAYERIAPTVPLYSPELRARAQKVAYKAQRACYTNMAGDTAAAREVGGEAQELLQRLQESIAVGYGQADARDATRLAEFLIHRTLERQRLSVMQHAHQPTRLPEQTEEILGATLAGWRNVSVTGLDYPMTNSRLREGARLRSYWPSEPAPGNTTLGI